MKILALDTTQEYCSVALLIDEQLIYRESYAPRSHTEQLLPQVSSVMAEAGISLNQLDALAFGRGPGSFTGLRIAAGVVQGLAMGAGIAVAPVSSLAAMAQGCYRIRPHTTHVSAAFDARIGEVYWGNFVLQDELMQSVNPETVGPPEEVLLSSGNAWIGIGSGWSAYPQMQERLGERLLEIDSKSVPLARDMIPFAREMVKQNSLSGPEAAVPVYLRHKVARTVAERMQTSDTDKSSNHG